MLRGHPSVFAWCCHNETPWVHGLDRPQLQGVNRALDRALFRIATTRDGSRYVHLNSATGDQHVYYGWYRGNYRRYASYNGRPLVTEYGAQALPVKASLRRMFGHVPRLPRNRKEALEWQYHCFQPEQTFQVARVPLGRNLNEFIANSQGYQSRLLQFATGHFRRAKWRGTSGLMQFAWCDPWPCVSWSVVDYWRAPKPGANALKRAFQPVLPSISVPHSHIEGGAPSASFRAGIWAVNDLPFRLPGAHISWEMRGGGRVVLHGGRTMDIPADSSVMAAEFGAPGGLAGRFRITARITAAGKGIRAGNSADLSFT